ncbi:MAG: ribulose-phosphate 3-epimerase [Paludibacteraceae bacterium]|nr:ribulose-phosphate 3-epimerase [Paludibacteraceae bacterium]MBR0502099.1 ribulose-phosphate 3-epimerase [Paludibacteraceae bacterium]MBR5971887.1 ribulose-phosphate 3-epimerase [Paludibacteraceae bacterium]
MSHLVAPSMLSADFANLQRDIEMVNNSKADWFHLDIMDGVFVPNLSFGVPVVEAIHKHAKKPLDVHLMIVEPNKYVDAFYKAGAQLINVHYEACLHLHSTIQKIKSLGIMAGVTLNPHTPVSVLEEIIKDVDLVMLMSVNPGFGGQKFIENTVDKTRRLKELIQKSSSKALIEIDGGVNYETGKRLLDAGADVLVAGSFVFGAQNPTETIANLKAL